MIQIEMHSHCSEQKDDPDEVKLKAEMQQFGDIVRIDMVDTYADLSMKTLRMFSILPQKIDADFYFKVDDDVAVNVDALADYLDARRTQGNLYLVSKLAHKLLSSRVQSQKTKQNQTREVLLTRRNCCTSASFLPSIAVL